MLNCLDNLSLQLLLNLDTVLESLPALLLLLLLPEFFGRHGHDSDAVHVLDLVSKGFLYQPLLLD